MADKVSTREAYGRALCEAGSNEEIVVLEADLAICTMTCYFRDRYPERFFNVGIAEANMIDMAAGMATTGKTAFCNSFAMFTSGRGYDQIRNSVAYPRLNVKIIGSHAGLTVGEDGPTHQCIEDLSLMRSIPGMVVLSPCDANETREAVKAMTAYDGPCYMRTGRCALESITDRIPAYQFSLFKAALLREGNDVTIIATGLMVQEAVRASDELLREGIHARVLDMHTIKPIDREAVLKAAKETGVIITAEEHSIIGGLGSAVAEVVCDEYPVKVIRIGVRDVFGHSGSAMELLKLHGLTKEHIMEQARRAVSK